MATSESKGELVIPITVVQSLLLLRRPFVPKIGHVDHRRVTVNLMTVSLQIVHMAKSPYGELFIGKMSLLKVFICKIIVTILFKQTCVPRTILLHISMDNTAAKLIKKE